MSSPRFEAFLARLYSDESAAERFLNAPEELIDEARLDARERLAALTIDRPGLMLAAASFAAKRSRRRGRWPQWLRGLLARRV